ncbi:hypothetical protein ACIBTZ_28540 [Micromonospora sp. NPDC049460]|uniref:hypothetical protein n=1 Tax=Micromonospora sp. NPDC049460 TaxID=3364272 RepID=UPI00379A94BD
MIRYDFPERVWDLAERLADHRVDGETMRPSNLPEGIADGYTRAEVEQAIRASKVALAIRRSEATLARINNRSTDDGDQGDTEPDNFDPVATARAARRR